MRNFKLLLLTFLLFYSIGCQKDSLPSTITEPNANEHYTWNSQEKIFFDLKRKVEVTETRTRTNNDFVYHPLLLESHKELARQNKDHSFVTDLVSKIGFPLWNKTVIRKNQNGQSDLILIPFTPKNGTTTSGILISYKTDNSIKFDIVSRSEFVQTENNPNCFKASYLKEIRIFDKKLFGLEDPQLKNLYCKCKNQPQTGPPNPNPTSTPCAWALIELCTNGQSSWIGGLCKMPPHLDHDLDCIPNDDDQDWHDFMIRFNLSQSSFENSLRDRWEQLYPDIDYDQFFSDPDNYDDFYEQYFDGFSDQEPGDIDFADIFDFLFDRDHDDIWNWDDYTPDGIDDCDDIFNPLGGGEKIEPRTITCETYYVRNCDGTDLTSNQWWDVIGYLIPCPGCTQQHLEDFEQILSLNLNNYVDTYFEGNQQLLQELWPLVQDCPAYAPQNYVFDCFDEKLEVLAESMTSCLQYSFVGCATNDGLFGGICPESFAFKKVSYGYTCEVTPVIFKYFDTQMGGQRTIKVGAICIQTTEFDNDGNLIDKDEAAALMAEAWQSAQDITQDEMGASNWSLTDLQYRELFRFNLQVAMTLEFGGSFSGGSLTVSLGPCQGNVPKRKPKYSIFC